MTLTKTRLLHDIISNICNLISDSSSVDGPTVLQLAPHISTLQPQSCRRPSNHEPLDLSSPRIITRKTKPFPEKSLPAFLVPYFGRILRIPTTSNRSRSDFRASPLVFSQNNTCQRADKQGDVPYVGFPGRRRRPVGMFSTGYPQQILVSTWRTASL